MNSPKYQETVAAFAQNTYKEFSHDPALLARATDAALLTCAAIMKAMNTSRQGA
ncbi:hypothetical protein [Cupriavidus basilensis]|uniref:hypothetical protein n=1 Tax=Cupriavidus basilensis TaxID=68895 RepID=UPI0020A6A475|nr:hypothetical protein [Cupriavidus basilensis]MCP3023251.1 hypothetical protein [Cupriavidus basilensis]